MTSPHRPQQTEAIPARALDHRSLRTLTLEVLGRPPYLREYEAWLGKGRLEWLEAHVLSEAAWAHWLDEQLYYFFLIDNFRPETQRISEMPRKLAEGRLDVREALHRIALSSSFELRNPGADTFVTVVMEQVVGLDVSKNRRDLEIGKGLYDGREGLFLGKRGSSQADVVRIAVEDKRSMRSFIAREFERLMQSAPEKKELARWSREVQRDPRSFTDLLHEWFQSEAFERRLATPVALPNRLFVKALFVDLTDRLPSSDEAEALREAMDGLADSRPLRNILTRLFLDSGRADLPRREELRDPRAWITDHFLRFLARAPREAELEVFIEALTSPEGRPETALYALLSSPEYHRY